MTDRSDDFTDVNAGGRSITLSWMHYDGVSPSACEGQHLLAAEFTDASATLQPCLLAKHQHLGEQAAQRGQVLLAKRRDQIVVGVLIADQYSERNVVVCTFLRYSPRAAFRARCGVAPIGVEQCLPHCRASNGTAPWRANKPPARAGQLKPSGGGLAGTPFPPS